MYAIVPDDITADTLRFLLGLCADLLPPSELFDPKAGVRGWRILSARTEAETQRVE